MLRFALFLSLIGGPALADCVTRADLAGGVRLQFQDGTPGRATALPDGLVQIDYRDDASGYYDRRDGALGIYEARVRSGGAPPEVIGVWSDRIETWRISGQPPEPVPGGAWTTTVAISWEMSDHSGMPQSGAVNAQMSYVFLDAREVVLSGCTYRSIPVEVTVTARGESEMRRFAYFPDLGFGVQTQVTAASGVVRTNGLIAMEAAQ